MTDTLDWQTRVGDVWADEWQRTDRSFGDLSVRLDAAIVAAAPDSGPRNCTVLDIGCGAGGTSLALATARPDLAITGIDLSPTLLAIARQRAPAVRFLQADAATDPLPVRPDLLVSRHGVMFFADPVAAFTRLREQSMPGARLVFSCFGSVTRNSFAYDLPATLFGMAPVAADGYAPGPFGFADPEHVATILRAAGWRDAAAEPVAFDYVAGAGADPVADATSFFTRIGPVARAIAAAPPADRAHLVARLSDTLARYRVEDRVVLPAFAWLWRARAGEQP
ncbi:class I SAM-dependent methyltransferase [Sphingomonas sp. KR1UV-12]|uniref:Class I SAM-dependent methyltransferase n=1 Tax=Sphingomonas aurea TaxID=3063994 RepID=A0ABT9EH92_9SPHN|nr:class I SAM-dependent methyltransferase [Sphingomonas sp. KR1UV-12]MDP1026210.1 class I SAM-dependent methyltransferase [Sphingomonas sp. KR1UV-12]